jgi:hypothetical protein
MLNYQRVAKTVSFGGDISQQKNGNIVEISWEYHGNHTGKRM